MFARVVTGTADPGFGVHQIIIAGRAADDGVSGGQRSMSHQCSQPSETLALRGMEEFMFVGGTTI